ncbi:MAG: DUF1501 domain-containing protein [Bacteroidota bacterium]
MKRRSFLKKSAMFSLPAMMGGFNIKASPSQLLEEIINGDTDRVLVILDMNGGNDGLNTFVPLDSYDNLANVRPNVIIPENKLLNLTDTIGLHPELVGVKDLFDNGNLTVVQGVAYPDQNRSHFRSADIWNTASAANEYLTTGWLGRYLDDKFPGYPDDYPTTDCPDPFAVTIGSSVSGTCQGVESNFSMAIVNTNDIGGLTTGVEAPLPNDCYGEELGFLVETFKKSNVYADRVLTAADAGHSNENLYPNFDDNWLGARLSVIARLISGGLQTKIYVVKLGGFDTHANQVTPGDTTKGEHAELLNMLSGAIYSFQEDLKALNIQDRVMGMTFSEFGRKIVSNAGDGTDHGTAAPMMLFGSCVAQGIIGANPQIAANVDSDEGVPMQYDFRSVYGSVLMDWFDVEEDKVKDLLFDDFQHIPVIGSCESVSTDDLALVLATKVFPNPFNNTFTLQFALLEKEDVRIDLYDVVGKVVKNISNQSMVSGEHQVLVETHGIPAGVYFARIQVGNDVQSVRVVKW